MKFIYSTSYIYNILEYIFTLSIIGLLFKLSQREFLTLLNFKVNVIFMEQNQANQQNGRTLRKY